MNYKTIILSTVAITFILGVASAMIWFQIPNIRDSSQTAIESKSLRGDETKRICLKRFDINLGDSFDYVNDLIGLKVDYNGKNQNTFWQDGKLTDFFSVSQPSIEIDGENRLNPVIFCTFDDQKKLKSFSIIWTHEGQQDNSIKRKIINTLIEKEHGCIKAKKITLEKSSFTEKTDLGNYEQEFTYDFSDRAYWIIRYSATTK